MQINVDEYLNDAWVKQQSGDVEGAKKIYEHLIDTQPHNTLPYVHFSLMKATAGDREGAIVILKRAVGVNPNCVLTRIGLARCYRTVHDYVGAEWSHRVAVELAPDDKSIRKGFLEWLLKPEREIFLQVALALEHRVNYFGAEAIYRKAITTIPEDPACWFMLGMVHLKKQDYEAAMSAFDEATQLDEAFGLAFWNKASCFSMTGRQDKGLALAKYVVANFMRPEDDLSSPEKFQARYKSVMEKLAKLEAKNAD
jgi:tetratricopeptide (TPR) repeat protein